MFMVKISKFIYLNMDSSITIIKITNNVHK